MDLDRRLHAIFRRSRRGRSARSSGARRSRPPTRRPTTSARSRTRCDLLIQRLSERMPERLQEEPDLRVARDPVRLSRPARGDPQADRRFPQSNIRADALSNDGDSARLLLHLGHAGRHAVRCADRRPAKELRRRESRRRGASLARGKSYFLHDLMAKVIFGEAGWVSTNIAAVRRSFALRTAAFGADRAGDARHPRALVDELRCATRRSSRRHARGVDDYAAAAGPLIKQNSVTRSRPASRSTS